MQHRKRKKGLIIVTNDGEPRNRMFYNIVQGCHNVETPEWFNDCETYYEIQDKVNLCLNGDAYVEVRWSGYRRRRKYGYYIYFRLPEDAFTFKLLSTPEKLCTLQE